MMQTIKKVIAIAMVIAVVMAATTTVLFAKSTVSSYTDKDFNSKIEMFLKENYKDYYDLNSFNFVYKDSEEFQDSVEIVVSCNMELVKRAEALPVLQGISKTFKTKAMFSNNDVSAHNSSSLSAYGQLSREIEQNYYRKPERTYFNFLIGKDQDMKIENLKLLSYKEILGLDSLRINEEELYKKGEEIATYLLSDNNDAESSLESRSRYSVYDRLRARDYALDHAYDPPEYSSDCANFVSQCLCYGGGIPQSYYWRPGSDNWIRTGYYNNGGVVPYMVNNGYFVREYDRSNVNAGCIVSWNGFSHVGLITYGDTVTVKYTAHTNARRNEVLPYNAYVSFYMYR